MSMPENPVVLYSGVVGLNNKVSAHRLPFSETGVSALEATSDIVIDLTGQAVSRRPISILQSGSFHSLHKINTESFYVIEDRTSDAALFLATISGTTVSLVGILAGLVKNKVSYFKLENKVYYSNGVDHGYLIGTDFYSWDTNVWPGGDSKATFSRLPIGSHIEEIGGRAIASVDNQLFFSEHGLLGLTDLVRNVRRFESKLTLIKSVQSGLYVSDTKAIHFLNGSDPTKWSMRQVTMYPAIEGAVEQELVDPKFYGVESTELACIIGTAQGPCIGLADGSIHNLINKAVTMPQGCGVTSGALMAVDETMIIQSGV